jgi:hypothetical protein
MRTRPSLRTLIPAVLALALAVAVAACTADAEDTDTETITRTTAAPTEGVENPAGLPDPLVPYSPSPQPLEPRTEGFTGGTLTLPTADGGELRMTLDGSALNREWVGDLRSFSVWFTVENAGDEPWKGVPAAGMTITDVNEQVYEPVTDVTDADLHPTPEAYDASNELFTDTVTLAPGESLQGVVVFRMPGGFRPITVAATADDGATTGTWATSFGPY